LSTRSKLTELADDTEPWRWPRSALGASDPASCERADAADAGSEPAATTVDTASAAPPSAAHDRTLVIPFLLHCSA
jgi:hypothetical protein